VQPFRRSEAHRLSLSSACVSAHDGEVKANTPKNAVPQAHPARSGLPEHAARRFFGPNIGNVGPDRSLPALATAQNPLPAAKRF
jgi:hypothetical protein